MWEKVCLRFSKQITPCDILAYMSRAYLRVVSSLSFCGALIALISPGVITKIMEYVLSHLSLPYQHHSFEDWWARCVLFALMISISMQCFDLSTQSPERRKWFALMSSVFALPFSLLVGFVMTQSSDLTLFFLFIFSFLGAQVILFIRQQSFKKEV